MKKLNRIYIPTLGRVDKQITYENMPQFVKDITWFVVQPHEEKLFIEKYPKGQIKVLPENVKGIAKTRKWIMDDGENDCYAMFDDDITFWRRNVDRKSLKKNAEKSNTPFTEQDWIDMINRVGKWFDSGVGLGGCCLKGFPPKEKDEVQFGKFIQAYFFNGEKIERNKLDWSIKWGEDIHLVLQLLKRGVKTRISDLYLVTSDEYYSDGGCNMEGRTVEKDIECLQELVRYHPTIVSINYDDHYILNKIYKLPKIEVKWKKAYNPHAKVVEQFYES